MPLPDGRIVTVGRAEFDASAGRASETGVGNESEGQHRCPRGDNCPNMLGSLNRGSFCCLHAWKNLHSALKVGS